MENLQAKLMHDYNQQHRETFNPELFNRTDDDIINVLKQVILSCQRNSNSIIHVRNFTIIEDYDLIRSILRDEETKRQKNSKKVNNFNYIDLKDSDIKLLQVDYYIAVKDEAEYFTVYIAIPRIVNKYYFMISGNEYYAMYQIVDNSTYNNSTAKSKKHVVTLKTISTPLRIYRDTIEIHTVEGVKLKSVHYTCRVFNKSLSTLIYVFAKLGFYDALYFLGVDIITVISYIPVEGDPLRDSNYVFRTRSDSIYVLVPKMIFDKDYFVQSIVSVIIHYIRKNTKYEDLFRNEYWTRALGLEYNSDTIEKGESVLNSLESIYDIITYRSIRLPDNEKSTIYHIIRWMCREFSNLRIKDNLDIAFKKIRIAEYIASIYVAKLSRGIYRLADAGANATLDSIKKSINIMPMFLLNNISKCNLVNYKNGVNDLDSIYALKYSYKGISGIADNNTKSVPDIYRSVNISHLGRIDLDTSSASDPGMSGILCPLLDLYDDDSFSNNTEPNNWEQEFNELMDNFRSVHGLKQVIEAEKRLLNIKEDPIRESILNETLYIADNLIQPINILNDTSEIMFDDEELEDGGIITSSVIADDCEKETLDDLI